MAVKMLFGFKLLSLHVTNILVYKLHDIHIT